LTNEELTVWTLANGWRVIAGNPSMTKPGAPNDPIVPLVLKATVVNFEVRKPASKWEKVAGESYAHVVQGSDDEPPRGLRVHPESYDGISMTCSVAGDHYSWYAANKARQFRWQHPWWYPQVIEMTPNVSGQTLSETSQPPCLTLGCADTTNCDRV
jgi:hypothetical protein